MAVKRGDAESGECLNVFSSLLRPEERSLSGSPIVD